MPPSGPTDPLTPDPERPFLREDVLRKVATTAELSKASRVLELGAGASSCAVWLTKAFGCEATVFAGSAEREAALKEKKSKLLQVKTGPWQSGGLSPESYHAVFAFERRRSGLATFFPSIRPLLAPRGRVCVCLPVRVGARPKEEAMVFWTSQLEQPLLSPRDVLLSLAKAEMEPEWMETLGDAGLDELYRLKEAGSVQPEEDPELAWYRRYGARSGVSFALVVGRRRDKGEAPPTARDRG